MDRTGVSVPADRASSYRPDIQGLRMLAVGLVVLYHLWPTRLPGGYVGVDVFFVISGFLITSHIYREVEATGRLRVARFWARRIRRLLPASLLVLTLSALAAVWLLAATEWSTTFRQLAASAMYVENWALAVDAVDYMAADNVPTVMQHYWSLSVEEQFYLLWPILIIGLLALQRQLQVRDAVARQQHSAALVQPRAHRRILLAGIGLLALLSLAWSIHATYRDPAFAYFSTFTRGWEFAAGAIAALLFDRSTTDRSTTGRLPLERGSALGWLGLIAIVGSAVLYSEASLFPGWIALLPVLGTVALIFGNCQGRATAGYWLARRPAVIIGDLSYSIYLIHWPLIVLVPAMLGSPLTTPQKLVVLVVTVALAWLSKTYVEDPLRNGPWLRAKPWSAFAFAGLSIVLLTGGALAAGAAYQASVDQKQEAAAQVLDRGGPCIGPAALSSLTTCRPVEGHQTLISLDAVQAQAKDPLLTSCQTALDAVGVQDCVIGDRSGPIRVALVGDSHAAMWIGSMDAFGKKAGVGVRVYAKSSCPMSDARRVLPKEPNDNRQLLCERWRSQVLRELSADREIVTVVTTSFSSAYGWRSQPSGARLEQPATDGFVSVWRRWVAEGRTVRVLRDPPTPTVPIPSCLMSRQSPADCNMPRSSALRPDVQQSAVQEAVRAGPDKVSLIDLTKHFCDADTCYAQLGGIPVYRDRSHLSNEYSRLLAPYLADGIGAVG